MEDENSPNHQDSPGPAGSPALRGRLAWLEPIGLVILALTINLAGNDRTGLWDRDEPRYAVAVREMRARGDWLIPTFNGEPRYHKPILIYWLMGLTTSLAGDNPFGVRLVSAIAGAAAVIVVWWLGRRLFGHRRGALAALIYATAPIVVAESKLATTDATLAFWLLGCQGCLWVLSRRSCASAALLFWLFLNLSILTKGPIGPAYIAVAAAVAWWCGWPIPARGRLHLRWGLASLLVLSCPWFVTATIASRGEFLQFAVGKQILHRLATDMEAHGGFLGYYPAVTALVFYPWSALLPAALAGAWARRKSDPALSYLLGWIIGPLILLECFRTKLIHYYLPSFASCALLVAWLVHSLASEGTPLRGRPLGRLSMAMLVGIGVAEGAGVLVVAALSASGMSPFLLMIALLVFAGTGWGISLIRKQRGEQAILTMAGCWASILVLAAGCAVPMGEAYRTSRAVGERLAARRRQTRLEPVLLEYQEPGVIYALGHPVALTRDRDGYFAHLAGGRSVLTVLLQHEIEVMRSHFGLEVTPLDQVEGFWLTKGKYQTLYIARVRGSGSPPSDELAPDRTARGRDVEQSLVK